MLLTRSTIVAGVLGLALGATIVGGVAIASIPDTDGTLHGCVSGGGSSSDPNPAGTLSVIDPSGAKCPTGDQAITFNQPAAVPIDAAADASSTLTLSAGKAKTVLTTKITPMPKSLMWTQASIDIKTGKSAGLITLQLLVDGKPDESPIRQSVGANSHVVIAGLLKCNALPAVQHTIGIELISSVGGVTVGTRTEVVHASAP